MTNYYCPKCSAGVLSGAKYCKKCGYPLNFVEVTCNACHGTGIDAVGNQCPGCKGVRAVKTPNPPQRCMLCIGTGINEFGGPHTACHGTGWMNGHFL